MMLNASPIPGSHTGDAIQTKMVEMLEKWEITEVYCFVVHNAANMKKAMGDGQYAYVGCFAHTLQLVIHDGILCQRYVRDILAICRRIVGHFRHSQLAASRLKQIQLNIGLPQLRLIQPDGIQHFTCCSPSSHRKWHLLPIVQRMMTFHTFLPTSWK